MQYTKIVLQIMRKSYAYDRYEVLWHQIKENFEKLKKSEII